MNFLLAQAFVVSAIFVVAECNSKSEEHHCILLIGGYKGDGEPFSLAYHPFKDRCGVNVTINLTAHHDLYNRRFAPSGCYLVASNKIVIRETRIDDFPPITLDLTSGRIYELPLPKSDNGNDSPYKFGIMSAVVNGRCLSCGGLTESASSSNECFEYDPVDDRWKAFARLPTSVYNGAAVAVGDNFYIIGGSYPGLQTFRYNLHEKRWYDEAWLAEGRSDTAAVALSDTELLLCGGTLKASKDCQIYNATQKRWRTAAKLQHEHASLSLVKFNGRIFALGSDYGGHGYVYGSVEEYDPIGDRWQDHAFDPDIKQYTPLKPEKYGRRSMIAQAV